MGLKKGFSGNFRPGMWNGPPEEIVDEWVEKLIQRPIDKAQKRVLVEALGDPPNEKTVRNMIQLIVSMPEYQLC